MAGLPPVLERARDWLDFHKKEVAFGVIIFLVATLSFALGYIANRELNHTPIIIEQRERP